MNLPPMIKLNRFCFFAKLIFLKQYHIGKFGLLNIVLQKSGQQVCFNQRDQNDTHSVLRRLNTKQRCFNHFLKIYLQI